MISIGDYAVDESLLPPEPLVVSGGIGGDLQFEEAMIQRFNAKVFAYDFTPLAIAFCSRHPLGCRFELLQYGISAHRNFRAFVTESYDAISSSEYQSHPNRRPDQPMLDVSCVDLDGLLATYKHIDILKLDIEGSEKDLLLGMNKSDAAHIPQIAVELHFHIIPDLGGSDRLVIDRLRSFGYAVYESAPHVYLFYDRRRS